MITSEKAPKRFPTRSICIAAVVAAFVAIIGVTSEGALAGPHASRVSAEDAAKLSPLFSSAQAADDKMPAFLTSGGQAMSNLSPESTRALGSVDGVKYWIAEGDLDDICIVALLPGKGEYAASTCQPSTSIPSTGLALQVADDSHAQNAYFLPAGFEQDVPSLVRAGDQLVVGDASIDSANLRIAPTASEQREAADLTLPVFSAVEPLEAPNDK